MFTDNSKVGFTGLEDSGKSYLLAMQSAYLVRRNSRWHKISGKPVRPIRSNLQYSPEFEQWATEEMGVPIFYWKDTDELAKFKECDIICDEIVNHFDARRWKDLSIDVRSWVGQASKLGVQIYFSSQNFEQVDVYFRRLTKELYHITKLIGSPRPSASKPDVKYIWGICMVRSLDALNYDTLKNKFTSSGLPQFFFLEKDICNIFYTNKQIVKPDQPLLKHVEQFCEFKNDPLHNCAFHRIVHS